MHSSKILDVHTSSWRLRQPLTFDRARAADYGYPWPLTTHEQLTTTATPDLWPWRAWAANYPYLDIWPVTSSIFSNHAHFFIRQQMLQSDWSRECHVIFCCSSPNRAVRGSSPGRGHCVVFLGKTLLSQCLSPARCINGYRRTECWG